MPRKSHVTDSQSNRDRGESRRRSQTPNRRQFLRGAAGAAAVTAGFGLSSGVSGAAVGSDPEYDVVLDIVDDLGADPTGEEPINDALAEAVEYDSVKVVFPDGEYLIENGPGGDGFARWDFGTGEEEGRVGDLALVGDGNVTLTPPDGGRHNVLTLWGRDLRIENFTVDQTAHDTSTGITAVAEDRLLVRDVHYDGKVTGDYVEVPAPGDERIPDDPHCLIPGILEEDGTGLIENVRAPDGVESYSRKGAVWVNFLHAGDLLFNRCEFSNFSDNAIYGSPPGQGPPLGGGGSVRVENCYFENNNVSAIRLGTPGSYAKNCTVVTEAGEIPATPWGAITSRAGWVWYEFDGSFENVDVVHDHPAGQGILDHSDGTQDVALEVKNCRFELNNDGATAIRFADPGVERLSAKNVSVTGDAADGTALVLGNAEIDVKNCCVSQTGENRDGISLTNATGSIRNASIDVTGQAIVADDDSDVTVRNLHERGNCPSARSQHSLQ
ncbi:hypothetical protein OB955_13820 [Halobacteria archaeon AArc-m2/3/4]|uniref:Right handed beta helix region n=1 Tax=Natronoglomus mannanivorans TaxID=2979990 RepID=A0ABT2QFV6_9EURY|nr:hypothetical protein [Halobacteria archaeon AArc-m2/3/4]